MQSRRAIFRLFKYEDIEGLQPYLFISLFYFWNRTSCSPGWPQTHYVAEDNLKFLTLHLLSAGIAGILPNTSPGREPRASCMLTSQARYQLRPRARSLPETFTSQTVSWKYPEIHMKRYALWHPRDNDDRRGKLNSVNVPKSKTTQKTGEFTCQTMMVKINAARLSGWMSPSLNGNCSFV